MEGKCCSPGERCSSVGKGVRLAVLALLACAVAGAVYMKQQGPPPTPSTDGQTATQPVAPSENAAKTRPRLIDLGATKCVPCKMMAPILEDLKKTYAETFETEFIDVWENPDQARKYNVETIPCQIFQDPAGKELYRHVGFFAKEDILSKWKELGVEPKAAASLQ